MRSDVRVVPGPPFSLHHDLFAIAVRGHSSAGRAVALQASGRRFDPDWLHHSSPRRGRGSNGFELVLSYPEAHRVLLPGRSLRGSPGKRKSTSFRGNVAGSAARAGPVRLCSASIRFSGPKGPGNRSFCFFDRDAFGPGATPGLKKADIDHESDQVP